MKMPTIGLRAGSRLFGAVAASSAAMFVFATPAQAATGFSTYATGAHGWGTYSRSYQTYTVDYLIKDTLKDGDCAYIAIRPQIRETIFGIDNWNSVGTWGYEYQDKVCGYLNIDAKVVRINVWDKMNSFDHLRANAMRLYIRVCRADAWADTCSGFVTPVVSL